MWKGRARVLKKYRQQERHLILMMDVTLTSDVKPFPMIVQHFLKLFWRLQNGKQLTSLEPARATCLDVVDLERKG
jgi:hypothetical protein